MQKQEIQEHSDRHKIDPDHELLEWEKWVRIRKEETTRLGERTKRPPADLVMNLLEKVREDKERKTALEHAQIEKKPTLRGSLWEQPERLKQSCYYEPVYELHRNPADLGRPRIIEHIGVPNYIQLVEKGLLGEPERKPCKQLDTHYFKYREKREDELKNKLKKIDPFRPDIKELVIKGKKPVVPPNINLPPLPKFAFNNAEVCEDVPGSVYAIRINNTIICKDIPGQDLSYIKNMKTESWHESCTSWTYYFKTPMKKAGRSKLYLKNLGTVTLRYCWKKIKKPVPYIPDDFYNQVFFFNKNEDVLPPGQSKELFFTFVCDKPGIYSEFWELSFVNICFFDTLADKLIINLNADSIENIDRILKKTNVLKSRIDKKATYKMIKRMLDEAVTKSMEIEPHLYPYKNLLLEAEMFTMKNPVCFYHQTEVMKMKELYTEMVPGELWDLSVGQWREMMMEKEYDERMKYYELLRKSYANLLKPWYEGEDVKIQKYRAMKWLLGLLADKFDAEYHRILELFAPKRESYQSGAPKSYHRLLSASTDPATTDVARHLFYVHVYEHVATTIELIAGVLSSIDLNRWIEFDFCRT